MLVSVQIVSTQINKLHTRDRRVLGQGMAAIVLSLLFFAPACAQQAEVEPQSSIGTNQETLGALIEELSEAGGYFDTDNLISNERSYAQIVDRLSSAGGAYVGVGPEQNFNYIGRTRPEWAFIVDVRRDNMLHHLLLNAVLAASPTPYAYLCRLFSRPCEDDGPGDANVETVLEHLDRHPATGAVFQRNLAHALEHIDSSLGVVLTDIDRERLSDIYTEFYRAQLALRFRSHGRPMSRRYPSYEELLRERNSKGETANFLTRPEDYAHVRRLALKGRLVPVVGDFSGPRALQNVGRFLDERGVLVSTFYTSNVEYYLLGDGRFDTFVDNVRSLPLSDDGVFVRAYFDYGMGHPQRLPGYRSTMVLQNIKRFLDLHEQGAYRSYWELCTRDYLAAPENER